MITGNLGYYYPAGADEDPNAPWHGSDEDDRPMNFYNTRVTEILERDVELATQDHIDDIWLSDVFKESENHTIMELLNILKDYVVRDLAQDKFYHKGERLDVILNELLSIKPYDFDAELIKE